MSTSRFAFCLIFFVLTTDLVAQTNSVLRSGTWFKFSVTADGAVRINYDLLRKAGVNPDQIDPRNIRIFTGQPGMLPQANSKPRPTDLTEIAIQVIGEQDGRFNSSDAILFFAQGPDKYQYNLEKQIFGYENNLFTDKNFYFLTIGAEPGKRITTRQSIAGTHPVITTYKDLAHYETEKYSQLKSGRQWFGEQFDASLTATIRFEISDIVENSQVKLVSHVMAQSITPSSFAVAYNNNSILTQPIDAVPNTRYGVKGIMKADTVVLNSNTIGASTNLNQDIRYQFTKGSPGISVGYLDFFLLTLSRKLTMRSTQLLFRSPESIDLPVSTYEISNATTGLQVWDVTDANQVVQQEATLTAGKLIFSTPSETLRTFVVFNPTQPTAPAFEGVVPNQNLRGTTSPELLIITHQNFITEAQRLATHRQQHSGLSTLIVTVDKIYNEFGGGKQDFTAIRDFIRGLYQQPDSPLKHVLLFGRGSYDYKNRVLSNSNFIPVYESRNSLSPLETYSSDDYYAFMEESEGDWFESPAQNHTLDLGVGRLPVKTIEEAKAVVDKLIEYDTEAAGSWQNEILFVADDGDFNIHHSQADQLATYVEQTYPAMTTRRFFVDSYEQITKPSGQTSPAAAKALDLAVRKGSLIVNFTGHGSERVWMDERILDEVMVKSWRNKPMYPLFVTATCEFGRHDDPLQITSGELTLLQPKGGSIGLVTSARPVNSSTNFTLNRAFYEALFSKTNNQYPDLGSTFRVTKNNSTSGIANRNFSLLADPSMKLALPQNEIVFDEITTAAGSSTLTGLSQIIVKGHIENAGTPSNNFNGNLILSLLDEPVTQATKGDENSPFSYSELSNVLYRGQAAVTQGEFETSFVLTKNVPPNSSVGTFTGYAYNNSTSASGFSNPPVGGLDAAVPDNTPPQIELFMGDTTFISGGIVGPSTRIVALLKDANGINITHSPEGKQIYFALDDVEPQIINDYYLADVGTDKSGVLLYPLDGLEKGNHTLTLTASDTHNNTTTVSVPFVVTDGIRIEIEEFVNYPNPFEGNTTLEFTHTRPGDDLEVQVSIVDLAGNKILEQTYEVLASQYRVTLAEWDGRTASGTKLGRGIYVGKLSVRSLLDGSKNEQFTKLIVLN